MTSEAEAGSGVAAIPGHDGDPGRQVWTTRPNADTCEEFRASAAPPHSLFETRAECESWVVGRECNPGFCFDGCNGVNCNATGTQATQSLEECIVEVRATIEFQAASPAPVGSPPPALAKAERELERALPAPARKVFVVGHAANDEAATEEGREQLRLQRA
ncbi:MAG TPA: hypothetical protein VI197_21650 [Polyangiaceae bacterium]